MDTNDDLHLSIPLDPMKDCFSCPVCMCLYNMTIMTPCGHRYCEGCILEWIDRKRKCPCCNAPLKISDLVRDTGFDALISIVLSEKNKAEETYFSDLINKCKETPTDGETIQAITDRPGTSTSSSSESDVKEGRGSEEVETKSDKSKELSPVEKILQRHIRVGIVEHERYYRTLKGRFQKQFDEAKSEIKRLEGETDEKSIEQKQAWIKKKNTLQTEFQNCIRVLTSTYDRYLSEHLPTLSTLPVTVFFRLYGKEIIVGDLVLQPHFSMSDVKEMLFMRIRQNNDRIAVFREEDIHYLLVRPYGKGHIIPDEELVATILSRMDPYSSDQSDLVCLLPHNCIPILEYGIQPGSDIVIFGDVKLRSELPTPCFKSLFEEGESKMDYYTCNDCSFNWVCRSCKEHCHSGHKTTPYVLGHQPTWACCYCPRKDKCLLCEPGH